MMSTIGKMELTDFFERRIGRGRMVLLRYGPGSGGELVIKEFVASAPSGMNAVMVSTIEGPEELELSMGDAAYNVERISLLPSIEAASERVRRRDRFTSEGILVTDLLEVSMSDRRAMAAQDISSVVTLTASKQVLPFRFALDSLPDIIEKDDVGSIVPRLLVLRQAVRSVPGMAVVGAPLDWDGLSGRDLSIFDCILEARAMKGPNGFERRLTLSHLRNDRTPPEELPLNLKG